MRRILTAVATFAMLVPLSALSQERLERHELGGWGLQNDLDFAVSKDVGGTEIIFGARFERLYVSLNAGDIMAGRRQMLSFFFRVGYRVDGGEIQSPRAGMIPLDGTAVETQITGMSNERARIHNDGSAGFMGSGGSGTVTAVLSVRDVEIPIDIELVVLPFVSSSYSESSGGRPPPTRASAVIRELGFPDQETRHFFRFPETGARDNFSYHTSVRDRVDSGTHWKWDAHPGLVIVIGGAPDSDSAWVQGVGTYKP